MKKKMVVWFCKALTKEEEADDSSSISATESFKKYKKPIKSSLRNMSPMQERYEDSASDESS